MIILCDQCSYSNHAENFHLGCPRCGTQHAQAAQMPAYEEKAVEATEAESDEGEAEAGASDEGG
jgi:Zn finger protein HypA/HybF involved in hydrogenase expression